MSADLIFILLGIALALAFTERRLPLPPPVLYAAAGLLLGLAGRFAGLAPVELPAEQVLFLFLPPLLMTAAYGLPFAAFRANALPIALLAVGLVVATMFAVAGVGHALGAMPWAAAFLLGAIVAPPDPVTATSLAPQAGLPHRLVVILEGEGLLNDAVAIVAYGVAVEWWRSGGFPGGFATRQLLEAAPLGVLAGVALGFGAHLLRRHVHSIPLEVGISLVTPFLAYHLAERIHGSGVLAVVALGFALRQRSASLTSPAVRLAARTVWHTVEYATTRLLFLLLGLLAGQVLAVGSDAATIALGMAVAAVAIAVRLVWMHVVPALVYRLMPKVHVSASGERDVLGWAGMRGVVSLALAFALPAGVGTPHMRAVVVWATTTVVVATLFGQGATLGPLIRRLGLGDPQRSRREHASAREAAIEAAAAAIVGAGADDVDRDRALRDLRSGVVGVADVPGSGREGVLRIALEAQRAVIGRLRRAGDIDARVADALEARIDVDLMRLDDDTGRLVVESGPPAD